MSMINLSRSHTLTFEEITVKVNEIALKLEKKLEIKSEWENKTSMMFRRKGASGSITIRENSIDINIKLGLMLKALKGVIKAEVEKVLDKHLS